MVGTGRHLRQRVRTPRSWRADVRHLNVTSALRLPDMLGDWSNDILTSNRAPMTAGLEVTV